MLDCIVGWLRSTDGSSLSQYHSFWQKKKNTFSIFFFQLIRNPDLAGYRMLGSRVRFESESVMSLVFEVCAIPILALLISSRVSPGR